MRWKVKFAGDGDVATWLKIVRLVAKLQKITDLAILIPLFLEGDVLVFYLEMNAEDKKDAEQTTKFEECIHWKIR